MQYKTKAKKSLWQNFLQDENIIRKIVQLANIN
ncbi:16S rRNA (adenine(1518)-N(6)/adenine(1519)-N(6))-dimethyltransferase, partial [Francisella tularensis subsp. holarctica]|nr:16S rRNA (adenine(1518)-N(6)/adenine(1519)-N(6))-dimethyltransferase [Francisella tularensis subsp. holarctica]